MMQLCTSDSCRQQNNLQLDVALLQNNLGFTCVTFRCVTMVIRLCTRSKMFAFMSPDPTLLYGQRCDFTRRSPDGVHGVSIHLRAHRCRSSSCVSEMSPSVCENIDACPKVWGERAHFCLFVSLLLSHLAFGMLLRVKSWNYR